MTPVSLMNPQPTISTAPAGALRQLRIIYADDVPELRDVLKLALTRDGHTIECLANGRMAFERVQQRPNDFDLVITDHHMPQMNGLEFVKQLRAIAFPGRILVFSSELSLTVHQAYEKLGVDRILQKPVLPSELRAILRSF